MRQETTAFAAITRKTFTSIGRNEGFNSGGAMAMQDDKNNFWITTADIGVWFYDGKTFKTLQKMMDL
ncbi:MAG: hypothetical protein IPH04_12880 [Saprospirales bacterium]|nr:hypothetical protein [Saprospirales bacterium]